ncbi:ABC transporter permease [Rhodospirillaceae bacterium KN72]|uniref:ABC transporter permease n=1 Tax=Pacificispira spongiicola TaxID=2729598 RepID=A0A7Y0HCZ1_9PROT|nr:ABC transporter permease [Pacificispira spongiicola]NMM43085.1 ABC transporter permease [Pacificispira spongiicola]
MRVFRLKRWVMQNVGFATALLLLFVLLITYNMMHPRGFSSAVAIQNSNEAVAIIFVAMAQTLPVLLGGLDLSVGAIMTLTNCIASEVVNGSPAQMLFGAVLTLLSGSAFGLLNGCIVVYGRIQPIIATLATGAVAIGLALAVRPKPGGNVDDDLSWALTNSVYDLADTYGFADGGDAWWIRPFADIPVPILIVAIVALVVWLPFKRSVTGRTVYAIGSAEGAAYMSGLPINRAKITAFTLGGFLAACGGLYLAIQTSSGNADIQQAGAYTLNSIAAVVLGGTSLLGGSGGAIGSLVGAMILRVISFFFRILDIDPLLQPLIEGFVLLTAVSVGAFRTLRVKNKLDLFR